MRFIWSLVLLATLIVLSPPQAKASTFSLPLSGEVEIVGDIPNPVSISIAISVNPLGASYWIVSTSIEQSGDAGGTFSNPQGCIGGACGTFGGFFVCGGRIGCGIDPPVGSVVSRGGVVSLTISDTSRFLMIDTSVADDSLIALDLTAILPEGLQVLVLNDPVPEGVATTPVPAALPLFASGLGAIGLLRWRKKRSAAVASPN